MKKTFWGLLCCCSSLLCASDVGDVHPKLGSEEEITQRVYAHLLIRDSISATEEAEAGLSHFPLSKSLQNAYLSALSEKGEEIEALEHWKKIVTTFKDEEKNRHLLEVLAWGVLKKGERSPQMMVRMSSLLGAALTHDARAVPLLVAEMRDTNAFLRALAVKLAATYGDGPLQIELQRLLQEEKIWYVRIEVIKAIGVLHITEAREKLKEIIGNPKTLVEEKVAAIASLVNMYESIDEREFKGLIKNERAGMRQLACEIVTHLDLKEKVAAIVPLVNDTSPDVRIAALNTIGLLGIKKYREGTMADYIRPHLTDSSEEVAITTAWTGMLLGDKTGENALKQWILDANPESRRLASAALAATGQAGVDLSWKMMRASSDPYVKANLAMMLIGQRKHVELACDTLFAILERGKEGLWMWDNASNPLFRSLAPSVVRHVDQKPNYPVVIDQLVRLDLLSVLSVMRYPKAQEAVKHFLLDRSWGVTGAAAATLLQEGDDQALDLVRGLLEDDNEKVRIQAALIIALIGNDTTVVPILQQAYFKVDRDMKIYILEALAHIGDPSSIPFLIEILNEPFQVLRVVAASALIQCLYH